eukprot:Lankesteria_metandrocarpae@DN2945_c0_g1_i1.p1
MFGARINEAAVPFSAGAAIRPSPYSVQYPTTTDVGAAAGVYGPTGGMPVYTITGADAHPLHNTVGQYHQTQLPAMPVGIETSQTFNAVPTDAVAHAGYGRMPDVSTKDRIASQHTIDVPSFKSLSGTIIVVILVMTVISLVTCLGRADFNFVFYLLGYLVWCIESEAVTITPYNIRTVGNRGSFVPEPRALRNDFNPSWVSSYVCSRKMYRAVQQFTFLLLAAALVDIFWLLLAHSTWLCDTANDNTAAVIATTADAAVGTGALVAAAARYLTPSSVFAAVADLVNSNGESTGELGPSPQLSSSSAGPTWCFTGENQHMALVFGMHRFVLFASTLNTLLKTIAVSLSFVWLSGQKKFLNSSGRSR